MKEVIAATVSLLEDLHDPNLRSMCPGRRNWLIQTYDNTYTAGPFGRHYHISWLLTDIAKHNIHFYEFTYKKDYEAVKKALDSYGYVGYSV